MPLAMGKPDIRKELTSASCTVGSAHARLCHRQLDILPCRKCRQQVESLKYKPDVPETEFSCVPVAHSVGSLPANLYAAARWLVDRSDQVEKRRLSATGRPDDRDILALADVERHTAKRMHSLLAEFI